MLGPQANAANAVNAATSSFMGLTRFRLCGIAAILFLLAMVYFTIFESDPPPVFTEVEIEIPTKPLDQFDEKIIVLPEFAESPLDKVDAEATPANGVEIATVVNEKATQLPAPVKIKSPADATKPNPAGVRTAAVSVQQASPSVQPAAPVVITASSSVGTGFFVQVVALSDEAKAQTQAQELGELLSEPTYTQPMHNNNTGKTLYRVRFGPYGEDEGKAREVLNRLRQIVKEHQTHGHVGED